MTTVNIKGLSVDNKPRKDGRYHARYTIEGKQHSVYGNTKQEVTDKAIRALKGITEQTDNTSSMKYKYWVEKWLTVYKANKLRENTIKNYRYTINKHILSTLGEIPLNKLDTLTIQQVINNVQSNRQREIVSNIIFASITKAYNTGLIQKNIALALEKYKADYTPRRALNKDEIEKLLHTVQNTKYELLVNLYLFTGLRRSEALALTWTDIDLQNNIIKVQYQINERKEITEPKTKNAKRNVPILPPLQNIIAKYYQPTNERLFDWTPTYTTHLLKELFLQVGLTDIDVHCLRHTYATMLKDMAVPDDLRTKWLGHSKIDHKDRYEHIRNEYEQEQIRRLTLNFDTKQNEQNTDK